VGLVVDSTAPVFDMGDGARDVLFLYARPTLVYANFLQVGEAAVGWLWGVWLSERLWGGCVCGCVCVTTRVVTYAVGYVWP
jgi:hypothetical protein